jgi:hypothetical protein
VPQAYAGAAAHVLKNPYLVKALLAHAISDVTEMYVVVDFGQKADAAAEVAEWLMTRLESSSMTQVEALTFHGNLSENITAAWRGQSENELD